MRRNELPARTAAESIRHVSEWRQVVEDYRPLADSLEWQLSTLHWIEQGVAPFIESRVPFLVNNNGRLSADAAAVMFANCLDAPPTGELVVLELGAGTGLFARYFLDEFRVLCERESRDFYERLSYHVTDRSPCTVEHWAEWGVFREHAGHAWAHVWDASESPSALVRSARAVICNYVLDSLPSAIARRTDRGWEQLCVRTWLPRDGALVRQYAPLTFDEIRAKAATCDVEHRRQLLPLVPLFELETEFRPVSQGDRPELDTLTEVAEGDAVVVNYGAIGCFEALLGILDPDGLILVNDYGTVDRGVAVPPSPGQRFGTATAMGVSFPLLAACARRSAVDAVEPEGDDEQTLHARLFVRRPLARTRQVFADRFAATAREDAEAPRALARRAAESGRLSDALAYYRLGIERNHRDWQMIGEAAAFVSEQLGDHATGAELARSALDLNPWYSPALWNVRGECLSRMGCGEAHEHYLRAHRIHPCDVRTHLNLARSWLDRGAPIRSLEATAHGLANDSEGMFRHPLLEVQQRAIDALAVRWNREREAAARRWCLGLES